MASNQQSPSAALRKIGLITAVPSAGCLHTHKTPLTELSKAYGLPLDELIDVLEQRNPDEFKQSAIQTSDSFEIVEKSDIPDYLASSNLTSPASFNDVRSRFNRRAVKKTTPPAHMPKLHQGDPAVDEGVSSAPPDILEFCQDVPTDSDLDDSSRGLHEMNQNTVRPSELFGPKLSRN